MHEISIKGHLEEGHAGVDDRQHERRHLYLETSGGLASGETANVTLHNISTSGMLIETALRLTEGAELAVDLPHDQAVPAQVVWASENFFGCRFLRPIGSASLSAVQLKADAPLAPMIGQSGGKHARGAAWGKRVEQARKAKGLTLAQVADRLGVSKPTVWAWEKGKAKPVDERIPGLAEVLGMSPEELLASGQDSAVSEILNNSRQRIAEALGIDPQAVRILIEI